MAKQIACGKFLDDKGSIVQVDWEHGFPVTLISTSDWQIWQLSDTTANQNAKVVTVPAGYEYQVLWIYVAYTSDANAGNRQLEVQIRDGADTVIGDVRPGAVQAASLTRNYMFGPSLADLTAFRDTDYLMTPFPPTVFLPAGYDIRVFDNNNVSAADDFNLYIQVARREL